MRTDFLIDDIPNLRPYLETVIQDGGRKLYALEGEVKTFRNLFGYSGFDYEIGEIRGQVSFGLILGGTGFVIRRLLRDTNGEMERFDYFNLEGEITFTSDREALKVLIPDSLEIDLSCPILDHFYNYLNYEYRMAGEGKSKTEMIAAVERLLKSLYLSKVIRLPIRDGLKDPAFDNIYKKILKAEMDPVLTWEERQLVFKNYKETLTKILRTKLRAHRLNQTQFKVALVKNDIESFLTRFIARPGNNAKGILYRYTIGKIIWFFNTVKNNLGYSVALAVYGPFTYYFITMPMNPHAMQAVGKVRSTYLDVKTEISRALEFGELAMKDISSKEAIAKALPVASDEIKTTAAAPKKEAQGQDATGLANIIYQSSVTAETKEPLLISMGDGKKEAVHPKIMNMLVTSDVEKVNKQSWTERMSNFKQMQIAYEENIEYASRMGRLEQLETQYNFPMQVEATWEELERYNNMIFKLREENPNLSAKMKQYLFNEISRTQQLQVYLWDRMGRFILDQIYVMLDQDKEQKRNDYYVGRSFVFMQEMTNILSWRYKDFKKPEGHERIEKLAEFYNNNRKEFGSVLKNLSANSDLFKQKDIYDTKEFRSYMKRQWEILFLQNAKAEEASNMGLNMYIWSVRNTVWVLQSIYSAKREELALLIQRDTSGKLFSPAEMLARSKISMLYETQFHNLTLEYVGIREEIMNRLGKDIESAQRQVVIDNLREFLSDRDKLDGMGLANNEKTTAGTTL
jgi:hypothetical protein